MTIYAILWLAVLLCGVMGLIQSAKAWVWHSVGLILVGVIGLAGRFLA